MRKDNQEQNLKFMKSVSRFRLAENIKTTMRVQDCSVGLVQAGFSLCLSSG